MNYQVTLSDQITLTDSIRLISPQTALRLQKIPVYLGYADTGALRLQKIPVYLGYTDTGAIRIQKFPVYIAYTTDPPLGTSVADLGDVLSLSDEILLSTNIDAILEDNFSLSDGEVSYVLSVTLFLNLEEVFDHITDEEVQYDSSVVLAFEDILSAQDTPLITLAYLLPVSDYYSYQDNINIENLLSVHLHDVRLLSDHILTLFTRENSMTDSLTWQDNALISLSTAPFESFEDQLNIEDAINLSLNISIPVSVSINDGLHLTDSISFINMDINDYIRRYLNDRLFKQGDIYAVIGNKVNFTDKVTVRLN